MASFRKIFKSVWLKPFCSLIFYVALLTCRIDCQELTPSLKKPLQLYQFQYEQQQKQHQLYHQQQNEYQKHKIQQQQEHQKQQQNSNQLQSQMIEAETSLMAGIDSTTNMKNEMTKNADGRKYSRRTGGCKRKRQSLAAASSTVKPKIETIQDWRGIVEHQVTVLPVASLLQLKANDTSNKQNNNQTLDPVVEKIHPSFGALGKEETVSKKSEKQVQDPLAEANSLRTNNSYRKPYSLAKKENILTMNEKFEKPTNKSNLRNLSDLKNILKSSGGLSLSEILQQKSLSLDDLLKGKNNALLALQATSISPATRKPIQLPKLSQQTSIKINSITNNTNLIRNSTSINPSGDSKRLDQKNMKLLSPHRKRVFSTQPRSIIITQSTEKNPDDKATTRKKETIRRESTTSTTTVRTTFYRRRQPVRTGSVRKQSPDISSMIQRSEANNNETFTTTTKEPLLTSSTTLATVSNSIKIDVNDSTTKSLKKNVLQAEYIKGYSRSSRKSIKYKPRRTHRTNSSDDLQHKDEKKAPNDEKNEDRKNLLELIDDRRSGKKLVKVLEQRNMSVDQLIEQRERGFNQLLFDKLTRNLSQDSPGEKINVDENVDLVTNFANFPHFNLMNLRSTKTEDGTSNDIDSTEEILKERNFLKAPSGRQAKSPSFFDSWKTLALASLTANRVMKNVTLRPNEYFFPQQRRAMNLQKGETIERMNESDYDGKTEKAERQILLELAETKENEAGAAHYLLDLELPGHSFKRSTSSSSNVEFGALKKAMPSGLRSAMVFSMVIVLASITIFMIIFVVFRWKHRRQHKPNLTETYNAMKMKLPILSSLEHMEELATSSSQRSSQLFQINSRRSSTTSTNKINCDETNGSNGRASRNNEKTSSLVLSLRNPQDLSSNNESRLFGSTRIFI